VSATRPGVLRIGDQVRFVGVAQTVVGLSGTLVHLAGQDGQAGVVHLAHLLASEGFEIIGGADRRRRPSLSAAVLGGVPEDAVQDALRWERHIVEILTGSSPDAPEAAAWPRYDPAVYSLAQREQAKAAELAASGEKVTARTVKRKRQRYQARGLAGLVDWRADRARPARGRTDERVVQALQQAIGEQAAGSTLSSSALSGCAWFGNTNNPKTSWPRAATCRPTGGRTTPSVPRLGLWPAYSTTTLAAFAERDLGHDCRAAIKSSACA
jgi:putative transposase